MDIRCLLEKELPGNQNFLAGVASIDIIGSSKLLGTDEEISKTKDALKLLIESLFDDHHIAILNWSGDGGLLLYDASSNLDNLVLICDKLISLIPFF